MYVDAAFGSIPSSRSGRSSQVTDCVSAACASPITDDSSCLRGASRRHPARSAIQGTCLLESRRPTAISMRSTTCLLVSGSGPPNSTSRGGSSASAHLTEASATSSVATYGCALSSLPKIVTRASLPVELDERRDPDLLIGVGPYDHLTHGRGAQALLRSPLRPCDREPLAAADPRVRDVDEAGDGRAPQLRRGCGYPRRPWPRSSSSRRPRAGDRSPSPS